MAKSSSVVSDAAIDWPCLAAELPSVESFDAACAVSPQELRSTELPDLIVSVDRLISRLQAVQMAAVAEFARPGRAGSMQRLIDALTDKAGFALNPDGTLDAERLQSLIEEQARVMAGAQIAAALHQPPIGAGRRVDAALDLVDELPETLSALRDGLIDLPRARTIAERTQNLPPEMRRAVQCAVLPLAQSRTPGQLNPMIDRRVIAKDPEAAWKRCQRARQDRFVEYTPGLDGMGTIKAHLPAEGAVTVFDVLDSMARATEGMDARPIGARRADALVDMCEELLTSGRLDLGDVVSNASSGDSGTDDAATATGSDDSRLAPSSPDDGLGGDLPAPIEAAAGSAPAGRKLSRVVKQHGRSTHFNLTMSVEAFLGLSDDPAELTGHGLIPAALARLLKKSARSLAVVTVDGKGHAVGVGATVYAPNRLITDQVITAAGTCRFPSCRVPAASCDLDHREPFDHSHPERGGLTRPGNLDPECTKHHGLKTHTDWSAVRSTDDGVTMIWTSPTGHRYADHPREFTLPEAERQLLQQSRTVMDRGAGCGCGGDGGRDDQARPLTVETNPGPTQAELTRLLIARKQQQDEDAEREQQRQRLNLRANPVWMYRLGLPADHQRRLDDGAEDQLVEDDDFDIDEYYRNYQPPTQAFLKRFCPAQFSIEQAAAERAAHPDSDVPPF